jgi:phage repressor protein C with HTH and peptisase S24 domain
LKKACNLSNNSIQTAIKRKSNLKDKTLNKILDTFPEINPTWLLTGKESMLKEESITNKNNKGIPYFNNSASENSIEWFIKNLNSPKSYIQLPGVQDCDFAINIVERSMTPTLNPSDVIVCKKITDRSIILFGSVYFIVTQDLFTVKILKPGNKNKTIKLCNSNDFNDSLEIHRDKILNLYLVKCIFRKIQF